MSTKGVIKSLEKLNARVERFDGYVQNAVRSAGGILKKVRDGNSVSEEEARTNFQNLSRVVAASIATMNDVYLDNSDVEVSPSTKKGGKKYSKSEWMGAIIEVLSDPGYTKDDILVALGNIKARYESSSSGEGNDDFEVIIQRIVDLGYSA